VGGYDDWLRQGGKWIKPGINQAEEKSIIKKEAEKPASVATSASKPKKLSYKLQKEFDDLPQKIEGLEQQLAKLQSDIGDQNFYSKPQKEIDSHLSLLAKVEADLEASFERWAELESMQNG
jgi:ABC transport system ATP-binding/permease protein